ncbi:hypothetical protein OG900_05365 [Streptomyces sp. NBC_00433]
MDPHGGMGEVGGVQGEAGGQRLVAAAVGDCKLYVAVQDLDTPAGPGGELEIGARLPGMDGALDGLAQFAQHLVTRFAQTDVQKVTVQFGCDIVLESGTFLAVIGKASSTSSLTVGLEWVRPTTD